MRQGQQNRRGRGRNNNGHQSHNQGHNQGHHNNRKPQNALSKSYESSGPDVKIRGTAHHIAEKYMHLARDASSSGDFITAENYLQHAEHYNRIIMAAQTANTGTFQNQPGYQDQSQPSYGDNTGDSHQGNGLANGNGNGNGYVHHDQPRMQPEPLPRQHHEQPPRQHHQPRPSVSPRVEDALPNFLTQPLPVADAQPPATRAPREPRDPDAIRPRRRRRPVNGREGAVAGEAHANGAAGHADGPEDRGPDDLPN